jgi:hypothetical protein
MLTRVCLHQQTLKQHWLVIDISFYAHGYRGWLLLMAGMILRQP